MSSPSLLRWLFAVAFSLPVLAAGQTLNIANDVQKFVTLPSTTATVTGKSELHISGTGDPLAGSVIHLNSPDAWLFLSAFPPSQVVSTFLGRVRVNGAGAVADTNVRVVQHGIGAVVIPQAPSFAPLEVFDGRHFTGPSRFLRPYEEYNDSRLGPFRSAISSFRLKRGFTATVAENENGTGASRNYVAQDGDLEVSVLPAALDNKIRFVRIFPWRWVTKKGSCDIDPVALKASWHYNWNISLNSARDWEYVAIKQQPYWPSLTPTSQWQSRGINHLLGFNEPNNSVEDAYENLSPPGSSADAVARWPELLATGLRVGAPAVTDGGYAWIVDFMNRADAAGYRVDYVPIHYYRSFSNNSNAAGATTNLYNFLKGIYDAVKRPLWVTEFNNGANWTGDADPTFDQNKNVVEAMINMMDTTPWIERYAVYSAVEEVRQVYNNAGSLTPMGVMYRDHVAPLAYQQALPEPGTTAAAQYAFNNEFRDSLGNGHDAMAIGAPTFTAGKYGAAVALDGATDYLQVSPQLGDSTDFSFAGWVKWNGGSNWQRIFDFGEGTSRYFFLCPRTSGGNLRFAINTGSGEQVLNAPGLAAGVWTHLAVTIGGSTGKLFVNGAVVATNSGMTYNPVDVATKLNFIGKSQYAVDPLFSGQLDDLRFFSTALSDAQIAVIAANAPPQFNSERLAGGNAARGQQYTASLAGSVTGGSGALTFSKIAGPAWLAVAANGSLTGVPGPADAGANRFFVRVSDTNGGALATATLEITVADPPGLVARYSFENTANDQFGSAHGVTTGAPGYTTGRFGSALSLDGTDDFVTLPAGVADSDEITLAVWFWRDSVASWMRLFDFGSGGSEYMFLSPRSSGTALIRFAIKNGGAEQTLSSPSLPTGQWVHAAVTLGANVGRLYVNGTLADTQPITIKPSDFAHVFNYLGKSQFTDPLFDGRLDEFLIFNQVLSATQIAALYNGGRPPAFTADPLTEPAASPGEIYEQTIAGSATDPDAGSALVYSKVSGPAWLSVAADGRISGVPTAGDAGVNRFVVRVTDPTQLADEAVLNIPVATSSGLLAHYQFDGGTTDNLGGVAGVASGAPAYESGVFDRAIKFDGVDDSLRLPAGLISGLSDATFATRVRWDGGNIWQRVFDFGNNTTQYLMLTPSSANGRVSFAITAGGTAGEQRLEGSAPLPIREWAHVAVTLLGNTGTLYVNGAAVASGTITLDPSALTPAGNNLLGRSQYAADPLLNGAIDDFRIYNRGLSAAEIASLAAPPPAIAVADSSFNAWSAGISFPAGQSGAWADPDLDGLGNAWEYLIGSNPTLAGSGALPPAQRKSAAQLGLSGSKTYLTLQVRVRKRHLGTTIIPEAAASVAGLAAPEAASRAHPIGTPISDGEFESRTFYSDVPIEDAPSGVGMLRLRLGFE